MLQPSLYQSQALPVIYIRILPHGGGNSGWQLQTQRADVALFSFVSFLLFLLFLKLEKSAVSDNRQTLSFDTHAVVGDIS